jgi:isocitrate dehydrogenase (NAD+)
MKVALIRGDGIGPEITAAAQQVLDAAGVAIDWVEAPMGHSLGLPLESLETVRRLGLALKGPLIAERCSGGITVEDRHYPSINNGLRRELGAYANLRPVRGGPMDLVIVREITEDLYLGEERWLDPDTAVAVKRITRQASRRVARFACEYAVARSRRRITAVHKANVLHLTDGLFLESARWVAAQYPNLTFEDLMVDATCYYLVKQPQRFDVLVLPNQYGDILSDLAAGVAGSLGLAPGANIGPGVAVFEAAHGAAPDIAGQDRANPIGLILSGALLLDHAGLTPAAERIRAAVDRVLATGQVLTPDLGGTAGCRELTRAICEEL